MFTLLWDGYIFGIDAKYVIPLGLAIAAIATLIRAFRASNSQPMKYDQYGRLVPDVGGAKVKVTKTTQWTYFLIFATLAVIVFIAMVVFSE